MFNEWEIPLNIWTHYLPPTLHPILRWSHHCSCYGDTPAPPMIIVFTLVTSSVRARRAAPRLRPFRPSHEMDPQSASRLQFLLAFVSGQRPKETLTTYRFPYFGLTADRGDYWTFGLCTTYFMKLRGTYTLPKA